MSDGQRVLSESELCDLCGVKRPRRARWAKLGYLRTAPRGTKYGELDAVELAAFVALISSLEFEDAVIAWLQVREALGEAALVNRAVLVLFDHTSKEAVLVTRAEELTEHFRPGHLMKLLDISDRVADARSAYRRVRQARDARRMEGRGRASQGVSVGEVE